MDFKIGQEEMNHVNRLIRMEMASMDSNKDYLSEYTQLWKFDILDSEWFKKEQQRVNMSKTPNTS